MKHSLLAASLVLVAGTAIGCGGGDGGEAADAGPPESASTEDFCGVFEDFYAVVGELPEDAENAEVIKALKDTGEDLADVGTPEDIPAEARAGFELTVETIEELDEDATQEELNALEQEFTDEEEAQSDAFDEYLAETCEDPTQQPSE